MKKWNLRSNLIYLRNAYGETQEELAHSLGYSSKASICYYESGERKPNSIVLKKIAIHYNVTVEDLCYGELNTLNSLTFLDYNVEKLKKVEELMEIAFPILEPVEKNGTVESAANLLWLHVLVVFFWNNANLMVGAEKVFDNKITKKDFYRNYFLKSFDEETNEAYTLGEDYREKNKQIKKLEKYVIKDEEFYAILFEYLKNDVRGSEYADYYIAFQYMYNLIDNNQDAAMNQAIGSELMYKYFLTGNSYAENFLIKIIEIYDK